MLSFFNCERTGVVILMFLCVTIVSTYPSKMKRFESSPSYSAHNASGKNDILPANNKSGPHSTIPSEQPKSNTFHLKSNKSGQVVSNKDLFDKDPSGKDPSGKDPINVVPGMAGDDFTGDWYQHWK